MPSPQNREEALFRAAVELPPGAARLAFLEQACAGDPALRQRLEALLAAHEKPDELSPKAAPAVVATLKLDLAQYRELAAFAQFGSDLDPLTQKQLNRGQRLTELLKQPQFQPLTWQQQTVILFAGTQGYLDALQIHEIRAFEVGLYKYFENAQSALMEELTKEKKLDNLRDKLHAALKEYKANFVAELQAVTA